MMGMVIFALFDVFSRSKHRQNFYLGSLLVLLLCHILGELFIYSGAYKYAPALAGVQFPIRMLLGPALFFYAYAAMSPGKSIPKKFYLWALTGPVIVILGILPFLFGISPEDKLALADPATRDPELFKIAAFTCLFALSVFVIFTGIYLVATFKLQRRHRLQLMEKYAALESRAMDWLKIILVLWGAAWFLYTLEYGIGLMGIRWFGASIVLPTFEAIVLMLFAHFALKQPVIEDADKAKPENADESCVNEGSSDIKPANHFETKPYRVAALEHRQMEQIANKLMQAMNQDKLFLEEDLSLKRLSESISVSENYISETLSQFLKTNFFHFVNGFRVELAKSLLIDTDQTVTNIVFEVGFNSKSTFNTAFKKSTNTTPSAYRNQNRLKSA